MRESPCSAAIRLLTRCCGNYSRYLGGEVWGKILLSRLNIPRITYAGGDFELMI